MDQPRSTDFQVHDAAAVEREKHLRDIERLARLTDTAFRVPVIGFRVGLDGLLGLIPGVGDVATLLPAAYIIYKARKLGVGNDILARMAINSGLDFAIGTVPIVGDIFDFAFKSNRRNADLVRREVAALSVPRRV